MKHQISSSISQTKQNRHLRLIQLFHLYPHRIFTKRFRQIIILFCLTNTIISAQEHYTNPIGENIRMGDPFLLLDEKTYYLYGTTGGKGFKAWKSKNFSSWQECGNVFLFDSLKWGQSQFWAPEVIKYQNKYYMTYSCQKKDDKNGFKICLAVADRPEGPFKEIKAPWFDNGWSCIDAHIFIDTDQTPYLYFNKVGVVDNPWHIYGKIYAVRLSPDLLSFETEPILVSEPEQPWEEMDPNLKSLCNEGAFVFKEKDTYYMTYSAGHYASPRYAIGYATAKKPLGPWKKAQNNPLIQQNTDENISGPGHNSITFSPDGKERFIVYHIHHDPQKPGGDREVCINRLVIGKDKTLKVLTPLRAPQKIPSGSK